MRFQDIMIGFLATGVAMGLPVSGRTAAGPWTGPNGGSMIDAGPFHLELVADPAILRLGVFDHVDRPVDVAAGLGTATFTAGERSARLRLAPAAANVLAAPLAEPLGTGVLKVVVRVPGQAIGAGQFDLP